VTARIFLLDNGENLSAHQIAAIQTMESLAAGKMSQEVLAAWIRERMSGPGQ